jgi:WD40 repeat protein
MEAGPAGRLSRFLVRCHPRRWRARYGEEMLEVLDQHHPTTRTVASLGASAVSTHLDPGWRAGRLSLSRLRRAALISAAVAAPLALALGPVGYRIWQDGYWHMSGAGGVGAVAFAPGRHLMISAVGGAHQDSVETVWDIADPARRRQLSAFQGGQPTALAPDDRILATVAFGGQPVLWTLANPRRPARIAMMPADDGTRLWGEAFSPDGQVLAIAYTDRIFLWDVASAARPRLLGSLAAPQTPAINPPPAFSPQVIAFSPDGRLLASIIGSGQITVWNVADPARAARIATLAGPHDFIQTFAFSPGTNLLAAVTYPGTVLVFSLANPDRPARTATISGIMSQALYPDGQLQHPDAPPCPVCGPASYAVAFAPAGRTLTAVVDRQEANVTPGYSDISRDTVFTWNVTSAGVVGRVTIDTRDVRDIQPTLAPDGRTVADGSPNSNAVYLWTPP